MAYAARYGKQPLNVLMAMSERDLSAFVEALSRIVEQENPDV